VWGATQGAIQRAPEVRVGQEVACWILSARGVQLGAFGATGAV
jgi:hypothetical protein